MQWLLFLRVCLLSHYPWLWLLQGSIPTGAFDSGCWTSTHASLCFPLHLSTVLASSLNLWGWRHLWCDSSLEAVHRRACVSFHFHSQPGGWNCIGCMIIMDNGRICLTVETHPAWSLGTEPSAYTLRDLWFTNFLAENLELWICFTYWLKYCIAWFSSVWDGFQSDNNFTMYASYCLTLTRVTSFALKFQCLQVPLISRWCLRAQEDP